MSEQYSRRNNTELAGILNSIRDNDLKEAIINIYKEHRIDISLVVIKECHRLPLVMPKLPKNLTNVRELL